MLRLLKDNARYLGDRVGVALQVKKVLVRDIDKQRVSECARSWLTTSAEEVVDDPEIELVVELMGGDELPRSLVERAIENAKGVVTANKFMLASHGPRLVDLATLARVDLAFEGAVGGGIPIIRTLREAFASDWVQSLSGILNGTRNYVLTRMRENGLSLEDALREAQRLGYAEADPALDIDGHDAAHKLVVLAMLAFGARVDHRRVPVEGIRGISGIDHRFAERFGYVIKHLAIGRDLGESIELRVHPALIPQRSVLSNVSGVLNAILLEGRALGPCLVSGRGAGELPTAVSVVADILDVARSIVAGVAGLQTRGITMDPRPLRALDDITSRHYLRFTVADQPGVMGRLAGALGEVGTSIEQIVQQGLPETNGGPVDVVMLTNHSHEGSVNRALKAISTEPFLLQPPRLIRIEDV